MNNAEGRQTLCCVPRHVRFGAKSRHFELPLDLSLPPVRRIKGISQMDVNHAPRCLIEVGDDVLPKVSPVRVRFSTPLSAKEMLRKTLTKTEDVFGDYISVPFRIRKKGVEAKFDTGNQAPEIDTALLRNVAKAHQ